MQLTPDAPISISRTAWTQSPPQTASHIDACLARYGVGLGLDLLRHGHLHTALPYLIRPVNYWRAIEYRLVWTHARFTPAARVLDIGSPKLLSLYLAEQVGAHVTTTDIHPYFIARHRLIQQLRRIPTARLAMAVADGRHLGFAANSFDIVYAISVVEHIPDTGDSACLQEIGRVLAPGGRALLTVPFAPIPADEYTTTPFYWAAASRRVADQSIFYQRRYDEAGLQARLIQPSGLRLQRVVYVGERPLAPAEREISQFLPVVSGLLQPLLSRLLHIGPVADWTDLTRPLCALIVLDKPYQ